MIFWNLQIVVDSNEKRRYKNGRKKEIFDKKGRLRTKIAKTV
jgi:hypothetical protein